MDDVPMLRQLGLSAHEATLYLLLLRHGETTAVTLARDAKLHKRTVYDELEKLQKKGLVSVKIKKYVKYFMPTNPQALQDFLDEKQHILGSLLPQLLQQFNQKGTKLSVTIFEGVEGMKIIFNEVLREFKKKRSEVLMTGAGLRAPELLKYYFSHYVIEVQQATEWRLVEPDIPRVRKEIAELGLSFNTRYIPSTFVSPMGFLVYADKSIIMLMEQEPILIQIISKKFANGFRDYFEILWKAGKK